jgi:hypothetical protein
VGIALRLALLWLRTKIEAEEATLARDRREDVPVTGAQRLGELAAVAASLQ